MRYNSQMQNRHVLRGADFPSRLIAALDALGCPISPTEVARRFNEVAGERAVSIHGVRKWLVGESIPHQTRLLLLSAWLEVSPQWLRYGDDVELVVAIRDTHSLSPKEQRLLDDFRRLTPDAESVVIELITALLKKPSMRS
jgi:hypothetical protein